MTEVRLWPLALGWSVVSLLLLFGWKRQAAIAAAGLALVRRLFPATRQGQTAGTIRDFLF